MKMKRIISICISMTAITFSCSPQRENDAGKLPNVVLIYLDDMGYGDITLTGATGYTTPNIDRLAKEGVFFSHYYSPQAVCSASRAGLLTGCYPNRIGITGALSHKSTHGISEQEETIGEILQKQGYVTAIFGKWHLGHQNQFLPTNHGFDEFYGIPYSNDMWPLHPNGPGAYPDLPLYENESVVNPSISPKDQAEFTTQFTERTVSFIRQNQETPFFVYLAHPMPHVPLFVSEKFKGKSQQGLFGDVLMEIDWSVGQILKTLEETNLDENTLLIFTSDNGPWLNYGNHAGSTGGLREGKGVTFEGGQRVPCLMRWKGVIPEGIVCNKLVAGIDILPTIASIANAPLPKNKIDGVSLLPLLHGNFDANPRTSFYYYYRRNSLEAVRSDQWKLVFPHPGRTYTGFKPGNDGEPGPLNQNFDHPGALYDLRRDPGERYDISESNPEVVERLLQIANEAREDLGDDLTDKEGKNQRPPGQLEN